MNVLDELRKIKPEGLSDEDHERLMFPDGKHLTLEKTVIDHIIEQRVTPAGGP